MPEYSLAPEDSWEVGRVRKVLRYRDGRHGDDRNAVFVGSILLELPLNDDGALRDAIDEAMAWSFTTAEEREALWAIFERTSGPPHSTSALHMVLRGIIEHAANVPTTMRRAARYTIEELHEQVRAFNSGSRIRARYDDNGVCDGYGVGDFEVHWPPTWQECDAMLAEMDTWDPEPNEMEVCLLSECLQISAVGGVIPPGRWRSTLIIHSGNLRTRGQEAADRVLQAMAATPPTMRAQAARRAAAAPLAPLDNPTITGSYPRFDDPTPWSVGRIQKVRERHLIIHGNGDTLNVTLPIDDGQAQLILRATDSWENMTAAEGAMLRNIFDTRLATQMTPDGQVAASPATRNQFMARVNQQMTNTGRVRSGEPNIQRVPMRDPLDRPVETNIPVQQVAHARVLAQLGDMASTDTWVVGRFDKSGPNMLHVRRQQDSGLSDTWLLHLPADDMERRRLCTVVDNWRDLMTPAEAAIVLHTLDFGETANVLHSLADLFAAEQIRGGGGPWIVPNLSDTSVWEEGRIRKDVFLGGMSLVLVDDNPDTHHHSSACGDPEDMDMPTLISLYTQVVRWVTPPTLAESQILGTLFDLPRSVENHLQDSLAMALRLYGALIQGGAAPSGTAGLAIAAALEAANRLRAELETAPDAEYPDVAQTGWPEPHLNGEPIAVGFRIRTARETNHALIIGGIIVDIPMTSQGCRQARLEIESWATQPNAAERGSLQSALGRAATIVGDHVGSVLATAEVSRSTGTPNTAPGTATPNTGPSGGSWGPPRRTTATEARIAEDEFNRQSLGQPAGPPGPLWQEGRVIAYEERHQRQHDFTLVVGDERFTGEAECIDVQKRGYEQRLLGELGSWIHPPPAAAELLCIAASIMCLSRNGFDRMRLMAYAAAPAELAIVPPIVLVEPRVRRIHVQTPDT